MSMTPSQEHLFLQELYSAAKGDPNAKISMYEVGRTLGLDKAQSIRVAEQVMAQGWAEIKTLSGAIGITAEGIEAAGMAGAGTTAQLGLERSALISPEGRGSVEKALALIQACLAGLTAPFAQIEEMVIDLKTIQVQLLSPKPKTAIVRETLCSLQAALNTTGAKETAAVIERMLE